MATPLTKTRVSLLILLQDPESSDYKSAWPEFVNYYGPKMRDWCRRWGLRDADIDDVTQDILLRLASRMRSFVYKPDSSFHAWLKTVTRHALSDFADTRKRAVASSAEGAIALESLAAREDLEARLAETFDMEVLETATNNVRLRVEVATWEAFRLTALEGVSAKEAARRLGKKVADIYQAKSNVQKMLKEEISRLEGSEST